MSLLEKKGKGSLGRRKLSFLGLPATGNTLAPAKVLQTLQAPKDWQKVGWAEAQDWRRHFGECQQGVIRDIARMVGRQCRGTERSLNLKH